MSQNRVVTVVLVILAAIIAWALVGFLLQALWLAFRLALMVLIGIGVFIVLSRVLRS